MGLNVAWPYLSQSQRDSFKEQARKVLRQLQTVKPGNDAQAPGHVVEDPNILTNGRIHAMEADILFSAAGPDEDLCLMHNDLTESNIIVDKNRIVGIVDWEMAGYFGWKRAAEIHRKIKTPQREHFVHANISEEKLLEIMEWNDLYD